MAISGPEFQEDSRSLELMKLQGCGNSFLVTMPAPGSACAWPAAARTLCNANFGIGSDGLLLIYATPQQDLFRLEMYNPDGSQMAACGNGVRCVCRYLVLKRLLPDTSERVSLLAGTREISCRLFDASRQVEVDMGEPCFAPASIPMQRSTALISETIRLADLELRCTALSMGNPHCVVFVANLQSMPCAHLGPLISGHALFPDRANADFAQVLSRNRIALIVWERGAGLTLACGSGACAAVVAAVQSGQCDRKVTVELPGGELQVFWDELSQHVFLSGPAREVCYCSVARPFLLEE